MKNILLTEVAYRKVESTLDALVSQITAVRVQLDGSLEIDGVPATIDDNPLHGAWLSPDILENGLIRTFTSQVKSAPTLEWLQTMQAGLNAPFYKQIFDQGVHLTNSDAQSPAIAEYVVAGVGERIVHLRTPGCAERIRYSRIHML